MGSSLSVHNTRADYVKIYNFINTLYGCKFTTMYYMDAHIFKTTESQTRTINFLGIGEYERIIPKNPKFMTLDSLSEKACFVFYNDITKTEEIIVTKNYIPDKERASFIKRYNRFAKNIKYICAEYLPYIISNDKFYSAYHNGGYEYGIDISSIEQ